jgi:hypothetical protein
MWRTYAVGTRDFVALAQSRRGIKVEHLNPEVFFGEVAKAEDLHRILVLANDADVEVWTQSELIRYLKLNAGTVIIGGE